MVSGQYSSGRGHAWLNRAHVRTRADVRRPPGSSVEGLVIRPLPDCQDRYLIDTQITYSRLVTVTRVIKDKAPTGFIENARRFWAFAE